MDAIGNVLAGDSWWVGILLMGLGVWLIVKFGVPLMRNPSGSGEIQPSSKSVESPAIPPGVVLAAQPLLTPTEATFYNMMRVAVQEQFLVFAQVPVWCMVDVRAGDRQERSTVLSQIAFKRVQFVLVHPGTLRVAKAVELDDPKDASAQKAARDHLLDSVLQRAGIPLVRFGLDREYSVAALAGLLGVDPGPDEP
jgi:hypothetical protein